MHFQNIDCCWQIIFKIHIYFEKFSGVFFQLFFLQKINFLVQINIFKAFISYNYYINILTPIFIYLFVNFYLSKIEI